MKLKLILIALIFFCSPLVAHGATNVFYSVGQIATDLSNNGSGQTCTVGGNCTVTILSGTATFNFPQTGNIGVGDRVTYNTSAIAYISGKVSTSAWTLVTAVGGTPADITGSVVVSITREYTSLAAAKTGARDVDHMNTNNLVTGNFIVNFPCYYDTGSDTIATGTSEDEFITDAGNYIKIYTPNNTATQANISQRHNGKWDATKYNLSVTNSVALAFTGVSVWVDGLQISVISATASGKHTLISGKGTILQLSNNILLGQPNSAYNTSVLFPSTMRGQYSTLVLAWNDIFIGRTTYATSRVVNAMFPFYLYNSTVYGGGVGVYSGNSLYNTYAKNVVVANTTTADFSKGTGTIMHCQHCVSEDATADDFDGDSWSGNNQINVPVANMAFVDPVTTYDFHLGSASVLKNIGLDLTTDPDGKISFTTDFEGDTRPAGAWDIGADEFMEPLQEKVRLRGNVLLRGDVKIR